MPELVVLEYSFGIIRVSSHKCLRDTCDFGAVVTGKKLHNFLGS